MLPPRHVLIGPISKVRTIGHIQAIFNVPKLSSYLASYWSRKNLHYEVVNNAQRLLHCPACLFEAMKINVKLPFSCGDIWDTQKLRSTGNHGFKDGKPRDDWVWVRMAYPAKYGNLRGYLPGRLKVLFTVDIEGDSQELALLHMTTVEKNGVPRKSHGLITVVERSESDDQQELIVSAKSLIAMAHLVQDQQNCRRWYINSRIDLWTFDRFEIREEI